MSFLLELLIETDTNLHIAKKHTKTIALQWWGRHNSPSFKFFCEASPRFTLTKPACYAASNPLLFDGTLAMQGFTCETDGPQNNCLTANPKPELIMTWFAIIAIRCCRRFDAIFLTTRLTLMGLKWGFALDFLCCLVRIEITLPILSNDYCKFRKGSLDETELVSHRICPCLYMYKLYVRRYKSTYF